MIRHGLSGWLLVAPMLGNPAHATDSEAGRLTSDDQLRRAVVKIAATWTGEASEEGSGVVLGYQENSLFIMTARHVVWKSTLGSADAISIALRGDLRKTHKAKLHRYEAGKDAPDLAVVVIENFFDSKRLDRILKLPVDTRYRYAQNARVRALGHPADKQWHFSAGRIVSPGGADLVQLNAELALPGNSGGPLLSADNRMIGIVVSRDANRASYALKLPRIMKALEAWKIPYRPRFMGDIKPTLKRLMHAAWKDDWKALRGRRLEIPFSPNECKVNLFGTRSRLYKNVYVELVGKYRGDAFFEEAWNLWKCELTRTMQQVKSPDGDRLKWKESKDTWGRRVKFLDTSTFNAKVVWIELVENKIYKEIYLVVSDSDSIEVRTAHSVLSD
jgi:hypothetical protein